jgi:hypothetical protein
MEKQNAGRAWPAFATLALGTRRGAVVTSCPPYAGQQYW